MLVYCIKGSFPGDVSLVSTPCLTRLVSELIIAKARENFFLMLIIKLKSSKASDI
jgi:hypothetical protein